MSDEHAIFVNGLAAATGTGTKASPYKTIGEAVASASGKLIVVCDTTYDEQVKVTGGVKLYGGFSCTDWTYETGKRAVVKRTSKGAALEVSGVSASVVIEDMEFSSADGSAAGESSVAALVTSSSDVKLHRVKLAAGKGVTGTNGTLSAYTYPTQVSLNGNNATGLAGGAVKACTCPAGDQTIGGAAGSGPTPQDGNPGLPALAGGQGGDKTKPCNSGGGGSNGSPAVAASDATGASTSGTLTSGAWTPTGGATAPNGSPGQGGGGGASSASGGGGGGGCGGCGGAGGPGGGGGGASIALIAVDSTVSVDAGSELVTSDAGDGGSGAAGQGGQTEIGFFGNGTTPGCSGGNGGPGASGGAGGGGAGGVSIAVMWKGAAAPSVDASAKVTLGKKGNKGTGGKAGSNDGIDGLSQQTLEVK
ncbi:MAG: hypothetical protein U0263_16995 [Polyangiaceae bacterium]